MKTLIYNKLRKLNNMDDGFDLNYVVDHHKPSGARLQEHIESCIHEGILNVAELLSPWIIIKNGRKQTVNRFYISDRDMENIIHAIRMYPITYAELVDDLIVRREWDKLIKLHPVFTIRKENEDRFYEIIDTVKRGNRNQEALREEFDKFFYKGPISHIETDFINHPPWESHISLYSKKSLAEYSKELKHLITNKLERNEYNEDDYDFSDEEIYDFLDDDFSDLEEIK